MARDRRIATAPDDLPIFYHHRPNRHFPHGFGLARQHQGLAHENFITAARQRMWISQSLIFDFHVRYCKANSD